MILSNLHTHTKFCDGINTPKEMVEKAIELGFSSLGFSSHVAKLKECNYGVKDLELYKKTINALKEEYKGKIEVYLGIEEEVYTPFNRNEFDYILGSCHYVEKDGVYYAVDSDYKSFLRLLELFDGNTLLIAEKYFKALCDYVNARKPDIVGHFDLLTKFDEKDGVYFSNNPKYIDLAEKSLKSIVNSGCIFEVNTGAISRGYRTSFYPAQNLLEILKDSGAKLTLSSDCHNKDFLDCQFNNSVKILKDVGFKKLSTLLGGKFIEFDI